MSRARRRRTGGPRKSMRRSVVVKVQLSLFTTAAECQVLVYNEDRSIIGQFDITDEVAAEMGDDVRAFFYAHMKGSVVVLDRRAPEQGW